MAELMKARFKTLARLLKQTISPTHSGDLLKSQTDEKVAQLVLQQNYRSLLHQPGRSLPTFGEVGFRKYSQFEEDGILLYLFSIISPANKRCVEICAGDGVECNTANLIINHGWWGCLFDGNPRNVERGRKFYGEHPDTFIHPPVYKQTWITAENINQLISDSGFRGEIDLLSLDMDGVDYWIWKAIDVIQPNVVVCEINNCVPPRQSLTVPYDVAFSTAPDNDFKGASLKAMVNLGRSKGYRLVGVHRFGFNAFFVKNGVADDLLKEVDPETCANDPYTKAAQGDRWNRVKDMNWTAV